MTTIYYRVCGGIKSAELGLPSPEALLVQVNRKIDLA